VTTTTFGLGADFDETLLQSMADAGGGHFYFIENARQIEDHIASEVGELLQVVAREVALEVTGPEGLIVAALSPYPVQPRGSRHSVLIGDMTAEQQLEVVLRVRFPYGPIGEEVGILVAATDRDGVFATAGASPAGVAWQYADDVSNNGQARDKVVDRAVARLFAARARQDAVRLNRRGDFEAAVKGLRGVGERISKYSDSDPELRELVKSLRAEEDQWSAPQPAMALKQAFAGSAYAMRSRAQHGQAMRGTR
jgi:Ca-activated chloride channel family protein